MSTIFAEQLLAHVQLLQSRRAVARVAAFIQSISERAPRWHTTNGEYILLEMRREDIADYLGMAPETVCRAFATLEQNGAIACDTTQMLRITDPQAMSSAAGEDRG